MSDAEVVKLLRACKAVAERLTTFGINIMLSPDERAILQSFSDLLMVYGNFKELKPLADRAGLPTHELGILRVRAKMEYERKRGLADCPRCGRDKYGNNHHYLCQDQNGMLTFPNIGDEEMRAIIDRVVEAEATSKKPMLKRIQPAQAAG
jgi:hypothetical protein